jgi:hypothetical protein
MGNAKWNISETTGDRQKNGNIRAVEDQWRIEVRLYCMQSLMFGWICKVNC